MKRKVKEKMLKVDEKLKSKLPKYAQRMKYFNVSYEKYNLSRAILIRAKNEQKAVDFLKILLYNKFV